MNELHPTRRRSQPLLQLQLQSQSESVLNARWLWGGSASRTMNSLIIGLFCTYMHLPTETNALEMAFPLPVRVPNGNSFPTGRQQQQRVFENCVGVGLGLGLGSGFNEPLGGFKSLSSNSATMLLRPQSNGLSRSLTHVRSFGFSQKPEFMPNVNLDDALSTATLRHPNQTSRRSRGILGFALHDDVVDCGHSKTKKKSGRQRLEATFLQAQNGKGSKPSKVDSFSWNLPQKINGLGALGWGLSSSAPSILSKNRNNYVFEEDSGEKAASPGPTNFSHSLISSDLEQLSLIELKQMCIDRDLPSSGRKSLLRERLLKWEKEQRQELERRRVSHQTSSLGLFKAYGVPNSDQPMVQEANVQKKAEGTFVPDSLADWSRTVDLEPLLHRREAIHREKNYGKQANKQKEVPVLSNVDFLKVLNEVFEQPSSPYSNREVKQMYQAAKHADQIGDRALAKRILLELKEATPHDGRVYRRLARMEKEDGNFSGARAILQDAVRGLHAENPFLWHGLGELATSDEEAKRCYRKAIELDPSIPHPYHALGTLEHTQGRIANAMKTLKKGIEYCPTNHRLHHALGDLYRDARMLEMAERCYRKALQYSPRVSHGFAYTALAYLNYEQGDVNQCRYWLRKAISLSKGRQVNAWVALAQLEESEGNVDEARTLCVKGLAQYERELLERNARTMRDLEQLIVDDPLVIKDEFLKTVPKYRSGDRFHNLYRTWARLEERYGSVDSVDEVYHRALLTFPQSWIFSVDWAEYYAELNMHHRAREHFADGCARAGNRHADPYRLYAQFEMNLKNYTGARKILYCGALAMSENASGGLCHQVGLAQLFHTWALCEWHSGEDLSRAESLFDHALRMTVPGEEGSKLRAYIFYSLARLEYFRAEYILAQHCVALCLKENTLPGGNSVVWDLWTVIAEKRGMKKVALECRDLSSKCQRDKESDSSPLTLSLMLSTKRLGTTTDGMSSSQGGTEIEHLMKRNPWHDKIFGPGKRPSNFFHAVRFPDFAASHLALAQEEILSGSDADFARL